MRANPGFDPTKRARFPGFDPTKRRGLSQGAAPVVFNGGGKREHPGSDQPPSTRGTPAKIYVGIIL